MNWKKAKDNEKLCNLIPVFEYAPASEFAKVYCIGAALSYTKISFILNLLAVLAYQTTKHIFESKKIGAGEMWSVRIAYLFFFVFIAYTRHYNSRR